MNKLKILLAVLIVALLFTACNNDPVDPTTADPTGGSEQMQATEEKPTEEPLPGVEDNAFDESDIEIPTDPVNVGSGDGTVTNTGSGNQGTSGNQGSSGNQGTSGNEGSSGNQGTSGNEGSTGNQGSSGNEGSSGNQGSSGNEGSSGNQGGTGSEGDPDNFYVTYEQYNAMSPQEQVDYFNKFPSMEAFVQWYNDAKEAYDAEHGAIEIGGDGSIDLGEIINP